MEKDILKFIVAMMVLGNSFDIFTLAEEFPEYDMFDMSEDEAAIIAGETESW